MLCLSDEAIKYAISMCRKRQGYKVGLALSQSRVNRNYVKECIRVGLGTTDDFRAINIGDVLTINFHNGSRIETMSSRNNVRGKRFHLLIADEKISDEFFLNLEGTMKFLEILKDKNGEPDVIQTLLQEKICCRPTIGSANFFKKTTIEK